MYHVDNKTGVSTMPEIPPSESTVPQWFTEGAPGEEPTIPGSTTWNIWQAELLNILAAAEVVPDKFKLNQIAESIGLLIAKGIEDADLSPDNHTHPGTAITPIPLAQEDLNTLISPGVYRQDSDANAAVELNYPEPKAGALTVTTGAGVQHRYHVYNTSRVYTRAQYNEGAFTPWALTYNTENKPTPAEIGAAPTVHTHDWSQVGAPERVAGGYGEVFPAGDHGPLLTQSGFFSNNGGLGSYGEPFPGQWAYLFHNSHGNAAGFCGTLAMNFGGTQLRYGAISGGAGVGWKTIFTQDEPPQIGNIPGLQTALDSKASWPHAHTAGEGNWDIVASGWGQVGTYAMAGRFDSSGQLSPGDLIAGSSIHLCNAEGSIVGVSPPGTWKCLGYSKGDRDYGVWNATLFIRVA
jgi:hypothetical protein